MINENAFQIDKEINAAESKAFLLPRFPQMPEAAVVLGSGLGPVAERAAEMVSFAYKDIPGFPQPTAPGHAGRLILAEFAGKTVLLFQGRFHYYEGHGPAAVCFPARLAAALGIRRIFLSNAAGGIPPAAEAGSLMLIRDHISLFLPSPLRGPNDDAAGPRFPDMSEVYSPKLRELAREAASRLGIELCEGVYCFTQGPQYETPAEIRALRSLGADAVGMSTVPEAIAAAHAGLEVLGLSCITNTAAGLADEKLKHEDVLAMGKALSDKASRLIEGLIGALD